MACFGLKNKKKKTKKNFCGPQYYLSFKFGPQAKKSGHPCHIALDEIRTHYLSIVSRVCYPLDRTFGLEISRILPFLKLFARKKIVWPICHFLAFCDTANRHTWPFQLFGSGNPVMHIQQAGNFAISTLKKLLINIFLVSILHHHIKLFTD